LTAEEIIEQKIPIGEEQLQPLLALLWRFGKIEEGRELASFAMKALGEATWRRIEGFLAREDMTELSPVT
jgi:hypothetical protein